VKGLVVFVGVGLAQMLLTMMRGGGSAAVNAVSLAAIALAFAAGIDAYRISIADRTRRPAEFTQSSAAPHDFSSRQAYL
jgi:hypothetical protein